MVTVYLDFGCSPATQVAYAESEEETTAKANLGEVLLSAASVGQQQQQGQCCQWTLVLVSVFLERGRFFCQRILQISAVFLYAVLLLRQQKFLDYMPFLTLSIKRILHIDKISSDVYDCAKLIHCKVFETKK